MTPLELEFFSKIIQTRYFFKFVNNQRQLWPIQLDPVPYVVGSDEYYYIYNNDRLINPRPVARLRIQNYSSINNLTGTLITGANAFVTILEKSYALANRNTTRPSTVNEGWGEAQIQSDGNYVNLETYNRIQKLMEAQAVSTVTTKPTVSSQIARVTESAVAAALTKPSTVTIPSAVLGVSASVFPVAKSTDSPPALPKNFLAEAVASVNNTVLATAAVNTATTVAIVITGKDAAKPAQPTVINTETAAAKPFVRYTTSRLSDASYNTATTNLAVYSSLDSLRELVPTPLTGTLVMAGQPPQAYVYNGTDWQAL